MCIDQRPAVDDIVFTSTLVSRQSMRTMRPVVDFAFMNEALVKPPRPCMTGSTDGRVVSSQHFPRCVHSVKCVSLFLTSLQHWTPTLNLPSRNTFKVKTYDIAERHRILQQKDVFPVRVLSNNILTSSTHKEVARQISVSFPQPLRYQVLMTPQTLDFIIMSKETIDYSPGDTVAM
jgi:hypothetical protein